MQTRSFSPAPRLTHSPSANARGSVAITPPVDFQARAIEAAHLLRALANADRLLLLCQLVGGERSVTELGALARIEQPSLSQQLGVLRGERLVTTRREGKNVFYRIASPSALAVLETLYGLFCEGRAPAADRTKPLSAGRGRSLRKEIE